MNGSSNRLGALAEQWDVPDPDDLKARLQPEPEVAERFYGNGLLSSEHEFSEDRSASENGSDERGGASEAEFEIYQDENGVFRWRLQAKGGSVLANSGSTYPNRAACRKAIDQVRDLSSEAGVKERS